jgi:hypothetical protein
MIEDRVIEPGGHWSRVLRRGETLSLVDLEGQQAVDFLCYNATRPEERYNAADTMKIARSIFLTKGVVLLSGLANPLMTIVEDTCGFHDTIGGCCSSEINLLRYGVPNTPNCRDNFLAALKPFGLGIKDIVTNVNFFMYVPVAPAGGMAIADGRSKPGDHVLLRAEMDVIAALSNCPQMYNPASGGKPTPIRVTVSAA